MQLEKDKVYQYCKAGACCIYGILTSVKFKDPKTGFTILKVQNPHNKKCVTAKGVVQDITVNCPYRFEGYFKRDEKWNETQFIIEQYEPVYSASELGCVNYLKTEVPGLGERLAREIYHRYGQQTISVLTNHPSKVAEEIHGVSVDKANKIAEFLQKETALRDIKEKLYSIGLTRWETNAILMKYGKDAVRKLKEECFTLTEVKGLGWQKVSDIADLMSIPRDDPQRIRAAIVFALGSLMDEGHVCVTGYELAQKAQKLLGLNYLNVSTEIEGMLADKLLASERSNPEDFIDDPEVAKYKELDQQIDKVLGF